MIMQGIAETKNRRHIDGKITYNDGRTEVLKCGMTTVGVAAYMEKANVTNVVLPESVTSIGDSAFENCDALTDICYGGSKADWAKIQIGKKKPKLTSLFGKATIHFGS